MPVFCSIAFYFDELVGAGVTGLYIVYKVYCLLWLDYCHCSGNSCVVITLEIFVLPLLGKYLCNCDVFWLVFIRVHIFRWSRRCSPFRKTWPIPRLYGWFLSFPDGSRNTPYKMTKLKRIWVLHNHFRVMAGCLVGWIENPRSSDPCVLEREGRVKDEYRWIREHYPILYFNRAILFFNVLSVNHRYIEPRFKVSSE